MTRQEGLNFWQKLVLRARLLWYRLTASYTTDTAEAHREQLNATRTAALDPRDKPPPRPYHPPPPSPERDPVTRSTPDSYDDTAIVTDRRGRQWKYSKPADVWHLVTGDPGPGSVSSASARSWQRLLWEFGPLIGPAGHVEIASSQTGLTTL
jgi:hypothetical protein